MNDIATYDVTEYDPARYDGLTLGDIIAQMRGSTLSLLKKATWKSLIARRDLGGLLVAASKLATTVEEQTQLFRQVLDFAYNAARLHMKLWVYWPRIAKMLQDRQEACRRRGAPFIVPGYLRCLRMAGLAGKMGPEIPALTPPPPVFREPLPADIAALTERVEMLELQNRMEREKTVRLTRELDEVTEELDELKIEKPPPNPVPGWLGRLAGWAGKVPRIIRPTKPDRSANIEIRIGNCLDLIEHEENFYDALVTDAPYSIALHGYAWDSTGISFSAALWDRLFRVMKPGAYVAFFAAQRLYHRVATACETAGFILYPFLGWRFRDGLPKPINLAELFDRDNLGGTGDRRHAPRLWLHPSQRRSWAAKPLACQLRQACPSRLAGSAGLARLLLWRQRPQTQPGADPAGAEADQHGTGD